MKSNVRFVWDKHKARSNQRKHGISFDLAKEVFDDRFQTRSSRGGRTGRALVVNGTRRTLDIGGCSHMDRDEEEDVIRIISARKATASERRRYEEG